MSATAKDDEDLLHHAFEILIDGGAQYVQHRLQQRFPRIDFDTAMDACLRASRLHELAYEVADKYRDKACSEDEALSRLRERCPGFAERTYLRAFAQGMFESR